MPTSSSQLHNAFLNLPSRIKEWLSSDQITFLLREITDRLGIGENKVAGISKLILRLAAQDLEPIDFINELAHELDIGFQTAKTIAEDIEKKVLKPIESELRRDVGVDLKLIYFGKPSAQRAEPKIPVAAPLTAKAPEPMPLPTAAPIPLEAPPLPAEALAKEGPPKPIVSGPTEWEKLRKAEPVVDLESFQILQRGSGQAKGAVPEPKSFAPEEPSVSPFILHKEGYTFPAKPPQAEPFLNIKTEKSLPKESEKPIPVRIEAPLTNSGPIRVVHYNGLRTPLNNLGMPKEIPPQNRVDLRRKP